MLALPRGQSTRAPAALDLALAREFLNGLLDHAPIHRHGGTSLGPVAIPRPPPYSWPMPLRYSVNVTLDGCCDHRAIIPSEAMHRHATENLAGAGALLFGRKTFALMEDGWRAPAPAGSRPAWMEPFAQTIGAARKYVVSSTLERDDWNTVVLRGDLEAEVRRIVASSTRPVLLGGVTLPLALARLGLIDEYEFVVHPRLAGHGPTPFAGLTEHLDLRPIDRTELACGALVTRFRPERA